MRVEYALLAALQICTTAYAGDSRKEALADISAFAKDVCTTAPINGETRTVRFDAIAQAKTDALLQKLAAINIGGAASLIQTNYIGVIQEELAGSIKDSNECKSKLSEKLIDKFFVN